MKIVLLIRSLAYGGAETQLFNLAKGLDRKGHSVSIFLFYPFGHLLANLEESKIPVISLEKSGRWDIFGFFFRFIKRLCKINPDVLYGFHGTPNILTAVVKPLFPRIKFVWGIRTSKWNPDYFDWLSRFTYRIEKLLSKYPDLIIANSHAGCENAINRGFPQEKMVVVQNGIDTERFSIYEKGRNKVRQEWGIADNETSIGLVGRFVPVKEHQTFLMAASFLLEDFKDIRIVLIGDGPNDYISDLKKLGSDLLLSEKIIWAGTRQDMTSVYNAFDIIVSSSSSEGFSNVIAEAMSCGVYPVVTNVGDSKMIVGEMGKVVSPKDPVALAEGLKEALTEIKRIDPEMIRRQILDNFTISAMVEKTEKSIMDFL